MTNLYRIERDSLGEVQVPAEALYGVQTRARRVEFPDFRAAPLAGFHLVDGNDQVRRSRGQP